LGIFALGRDSKKTGVFSAGALDEASAVVEAIPAPAAAAIAALVAATEGAATSGITAATAIAASAMLAASVGVAVEGVRATDPDGREGGVETACGGVDATGLGVDDAETPGHTGGGPIVFLNAANRDDGAKGDRVGVVVAVCAKADPWYIGRGAGRFDPDGAKSGTGGDGGSKAG
jgi:hypothetical protein